MAYFKLHLYYACFLCVFLMKPAYSFLELESKRTIFNISMYDDTNEELCTEQLQYITLNNTNLGYRFLDAGIRIPRGILDGNLIDMGNYYQCLNINDDLELMDIGGKYCSLKVHISENMTLPSMWRNHGIEELQRDPELILKMKSFERSYKGLRGNTNMNTRVDDDDVTSSVTLQLAVCIPRVCSTEQALSVLYDMDLDFEEQYCRLPNDKPLAPSYYVTIVVFSLIGTLALLSTSYDVFHTVIKKRDAKQMNRYYSSFSVFTNTRQLVAISPMRGAIECMDGMRSISTVWLILGHTFATLYIVYNRLDMFYWSQKVESLWATSAFIAVETFFLLGGVLVVYSSAAKYTPRSFLKGLHLFYLNRLLRMWPVLATAILLQVSMWNWIANGPDMTMVAVTTEDCRKYWWTTLLFVHNWVNPTAMCLSQTWYLAIDIQLYFLTPLVLIGVMSTRKSAWIALTATIIVTLAASTVYCFLNDFPGSALGLQPRTREESIRYHTKYYVNTLTRASSFVVGLIFGYILHLWRGKDIIIPKWLVAALWSCTTVLALLVIYSHHTVTQWEWKNQTVNNMVNAFCKPTWAMCVGWIIIACHHGYAGPVNWFLSLNVWKIPSRLSYAMYIFHYPLMDVITSTFLSPFYYTNPNMLMLFFVHFTSTMISVFLVTILVDLPFSNIIKYVLGGSKKKPVKVNVTAYHKKNDLD